MYHRVLPLDSIACQNEQPGMYVSPQTLDLHLGELKRHFEFVHLDDWLSRARGGAPLPRLACAITFDDGWRDNFEFALPLLRRHGAPATIFLVSSLVGSSGRFWPNRLMSLLRDAFVDPASVEFPEPLRHIVEPVLADAAEKGAFDAEHADQVISKAKSFDEEAIRKLMECAEKGRSQYADSRDLLSREEVVAMAATGLIRFGSHTATHFRLGTHVSPEDLEREVALSRTQLQEICGQPIKVFCFPNGETSPEAINFARRHYMGAVTTRKGWHTAARDPYLIRRVGVHEDMSNTPEYFIARVSAWV